MTAYYNEIDPFAAQWLRELIKSGHIAAGDVDERSIEDVRPDDIMGYDQCHFFAGIGGWPYALQLAGWPPDKPVWTGSCPCQPFSSAGKGKGFADERHLWPSWLWLIEKLQPLTIFGEQVAGCDGETWLDLVSTDLEGIGYTFGASVMAACGVGSPHIRRRLYWVGNTNGNGLQKGSETTQAMGYRGATNAAGWDDCEWVPCTDGKKRPIESGIVPLVDGIPARVVRLRGYGNAIVPQVAVAFIQSFLDTKA